MEQIINPRSKRRRNHRYEELEKQFQEAQNRWESDINDNDAWETMFTLIHLAVFNSCNKLLEGKLEKEEIEGRSLDITCTCMQTIRNKRNKGKKWKIEKVSSFVHLPCLALRNPSLQFYDSLLYFDKEKEGGTKRNGSYDVQIDSYMEGGIIHEHGGESMDPLEELELEGKRKEIMEALSMAVERTVRVANASISEVEAVITKACEHGADVVDFLTMRERGLLSLLRNDPMDASGQCCLQFDDSELGAIRN